MTTATATGAPVTGAPQSGETPQTAAGETATTPVTGDTAPATGTAQASPTTPDVPLTPDEIRALRESNARMEAVVKAANKEAEKARLAARELERSKLSEEEKASAELADLKAEREQWLLEKRKLLADAEARDIGAKLGLVDYRDALALIPADQIETDADGKPTNIEALFRELVAAKGYLVAHPSKPVPPSTGAAAGTSGGRPPNLTADELAAAQRTGIAPERYAALKGVTTLADWQATRPKPS